MNKKLAPKNTKICGSCKNKKDLDFNLEELPQFKAKDLPKTSTHQKTIVVNTRRRINNKLKSLF